MMILTGLGMWTAAFDQLKRDLLDAKLDLEADKIDEAFLGPVITAYIDSNIAKAKEVASLNMTAEEKKNVGYQAALATVLPTLAKALKRSEESLYLYVEKFKQKHNEINTLCSPHLSTDFMRERQRLVQEAVTNAHGQGHSPEEINKIYLEDLALSEEVAAGLSLYLQKQELGEAKPHLINHPRFMNEVARGIALRLKQDTAERAQQDVKVSNQSFLKASKEKSIPPVVSSAGVTP